MKTTVRTEEKCPVCGEKFDSKKFICKEHKTRPTKYFIDAVHKGKRKKFRIDFQGNTFSSLQQAKSFEATVKPEHLFLKSAKKKSEFLFQTYVKFYLEEKSKKCNPTSMTTKRNVVGLHLSRLFHDKDIRYLTRIEAQEVFNGLPDRRQKRNLQDQFIALINFAVSKGHRADSFKLDKFSFQEAQKASWTEDEIEKILKHVHPLKKPICDFISTYGTRVFRSKGSALGLREFGEKRNHGQKGKDSKRFDADHKDKNGKSPSHE